MGGKHELTARMTTITELPFPVITHTPIQLKCGRIVTADYCRERENGSHIHMIHVDKKTNQTAIDYLKRLQRFIVQKNTLLDKIEPVRIVEKNKSMKSVTFLFKNKKVQSPYPLQIDPYYEFECRGCKCNECKEKCMPYENDEYFHPILLQTNISEMQRKKRSTIEYISSQPAQPIECDITIKLEVVGMIYPPHLCIICSIESIKHEN
jgi:hypothetical protein